MTESLEMNFQPWKSQMIEKKALFQNHIPFSRKSNFLGGYKSGNLLY